MTPSKAPSEQRRRIDWATAKESVDLAAVVANRLGPPPGRKGERGRRLWWVCVFHEDHNPSLMVDPEKGWWKCYGCGASGDAASFVMRLEGLSFPEAVARIVDGRGNPGQPVFARTPTRREPSPPAEPTGLPEAEAVELVERSATRLFAPEGREALDYLTRGRRLSVETIRAARLGWCARVDLPTKDGDRFFSAGGWVIPWFDATGRLALTKIRQPDGRKPKYAEAFRDPSRVDCYPSQASIRPGRPLVVAEGEFDAMVLGQELEGVASVVTLGSASAAPPEAILTRALAAGRWYAAHDADEAGDRAAAHWPARRVRPPIGKDWTEVRERGVDLRRWWVELFAGNDRPKLYTWEELSRWRWGDATADPALDAQGGPPRAESLAWLTDGSDPDAEAERSAIQSA